MTGTGPVGYQTNYLGSNPQFWGMAYTSGTDTGGVADTSFYFTNTAPQAYVVRLLKETADTTDAIGFYQQGTPGNTQEIFKYSDTVGSSVTVTIPGGGNFGLYGTSSFSSNPFYSEAGTGPQHFALFRDKDIPGVFYVGFEDQINPLGEGGVGDFNDLVVSFTPVPLPGAVLLLGAGMARLVAYSRRRK